MGTVVFYFCCLIREQFFSDQKNRSENKFSLIFIVIKKLRG